VGKHTAAVRIAMAGACTGPGEVLPCGICPTCLQMSKGLHPDLIEIGPDPTKKTPVISRDQSREIVRQAGMRSYNASWRTFVIDPVDRMQPAAANALLKTLEEPPSGTGFVLVTSRASSLLPTILSRSQRVRFRPVPEADLVAWLQGRGVDQAARVARLAQGSPGRALSLAKDGLASVDELRAEILEVLAGGVVAIVPFAEKSVRGDRVRWQKRVEALLDVLEGLVRDAALVGAGRAEGLLNEDRETLIQAWADALWPRGVQTLQAALAQSREQLFLNVNGRLLLETLLSRFAAALGKARLAA
jgi:DNA polymerase-3 subunit delta'